MVRAAFEGDGEFPSTAARFGSPHHGGRREQQRKWQSRTIVLRRSCAFRKARKSGSAVVRYSGQPKNRDWPVWKRAGRSSGQGIRHGRRASPLLRTGCGCSCGSCSRLGFRSFAVDFALGLHRILATRLYRRRDQCDAGGGRDGEAVRTALTRASRGIAERSIIAREKRETERPRDEW